ncbi:MAG TPA: hypothetical protein VMN58_04930 [Acidimicrobiales bacterium]|nr:hypothetical protein [Acidimicrobiales bacterium]
MWGLGVLALVASACAAAPVADITLVRRAPVTTTTAVAVHAAATAAPEPTIPEAPDPPPPPPPPPLPPPTAPPPPAAADDAAHRRAGMHAYVGLGTWIDVYDWSRTFGKDGPLVEIEDVDRMVEVGVQTLYVQTSKWDAPDDILEPERLLPIIARARERGLAVVAWYLPTFEDPATDLRRLLAMSRLDVDSVAVDIESRAVGDVAERNRRLIALSAELRAALPDLSLGAIPFPPVVMEVVNPAFWPDFPWAELAPLYDVWLPMSYWTDRKQSSGYREGHRYTAENIDRMRAALGRPHAPVHSIGGIADRASGPDVEGMVRACVERGCLGGSLYDWRTSFPELWPWLQPFRNPERR